jgi:hypothetical protein
MILTTLLLLAQAAGDQPAANQRIPVSKEAQKDLRLLNQKRRDLTAAQTALRDYALMLGEYQDSLITKTCGELKVPIDRCVIDMEQMVVIVQPAPVKPEEKKKP